MALSGFSYNMTWRDFTGRVPGGAASGTLAFVATTFTFNAPWSFAAKNGVSIYKIDSVSASISLNRSRMWARATGRTDALLRHEQGHYDITALLVRQGYQELTDLLPNRYDSEDEVTAAIGAVQTPVVDLIAQLQSSANGDGRYDVSTNHGLNSGTQAQWNSAFTTCRAAPSGRLEAALTASGITI